MLHSTISPDHATEPHAAAAIASARQSLRAAPVALADAEPTSWAGLIPTLDAIEQGFPVADSDQFNAASTALRKALEQAGDGPFEDAIGLAVYDMPNLICEFARAAGAELYPQYAINADAMPDLVELVVRVQTVGAEGFHAKFNNGRKAELAIEAEQVERALSQIRWDKAFEAYTTARAAFDNDDGDHADTENALATAMDEAEVELLWMAAPSITAVAEKMRLSLRLDVEKFLDDDVDDPRTIATALCSPGGEHEKVLIYQDLLRLSALRPDIAATVPFDCEGLISRASSYGCALMVTEHPDSSRLEAVPVFVLVPGRQVRTEVPQDLIADLRGLRQAELTILQTRVEAGGAIQ